MSSPTTARRDLRFFVGFLLAALVVAGLLSYFASGSPDGLDSVALSGCELDENGEPVGGRCIAQSHEEHALADSPLADYAVNGTEGTVGIAGVLGVIATLAVAGGLFWLLRRPGARNSGPPPGTG